MSKQDLNAVRTAQDLERKYDLSSIAGLKKNYELQKTGLTKVENELNDFVKITTKDIEEIKNQVDGNITTWFSSGIPTLESYPANEWLTDNDKNNHLGDLYYDNDTGKGYRFTKQDDDYLWYEITDTDATEALALASKAQDTADSKRRVFLITPYVPYDVGDLWLNNEELYVCSKSKTIDEEYDSNDFEKATKYTDDSALKNFISGEYADDIELINTQIDKKAETWYQSSDPSIIWTTDELKKYHVGDLWYNTTKNKNYIYTSDYNWQEVDGVPDSVYDEIDGKAQIFTSQPTPPYYKGDLFTQGNAGDILVCITERLTGSYNANDWEKAGKYTDDTNLNNFVNVTYAEAMKNLTNQIDSKITTWYYSGEPTLKNEPSINWTTDEEKLKHTGDLYYDQDTGYAYRFSLEDNVYTWKKITDKDVVESLALANSAKDTADRKRQVFVSQPIPPYDVGDLWIKDEEIYRCQTSRPSGETFEDNDWIKATKYTDDTVANQVDGKLTILSGAVTEIKENVDELKTTMTNTTKLVDEQGNTIGTLQEKQSETTQTVNSVTSRVSSVENSLSTTNSNLSNLSGRVDTLSDDIQVVNAGFKDFKDNEYIQSIDNLQKQIDGAIQFWNGAEIPTLENYPANEWTTENDKINHQADIYTVVEDIDGEMKQGKSYRFDKIDGVWQWIELTDNELSAVQALAQEALDKAKANATEIGTIKTNVSKLQQTDEQIKASVESIDKQIIPTATATGSNIYVEDASNNPLVQLEIEGKSVQDGEPTSDTSVEIESVGYENEFTGLIKGIGLNSSIGTEVASTTYATSDFIPVNFITNQNYYLDGLTDTLISFIAAYNSNKEFLGRTGGTTKKELLLSSDSFTGGTAQGTGDIVYIRVTQYENVNATGTIDDVDKLKIQLVKGNKKIPYIPYDKYGIEFKITNETDTNPLLIVLDSPLRSLPNGVADKGYIKNNKLYVDRYVGSVVFNGSEEFVVTNYSSLFFLRMIYNSQYAMSNYFKNVVDSTIIDNVTANTNLKTGEFTFRNGTTKDRIYFQTNFTSLDEFKTWLSTHNIQVDYELAEPYTEEIGEIQMPNTFKGVNHITTTDELEPTINIEYVRDTTLSSYVEGQVANAVAIQERKNAEFKIQNDEIKASVSETQSSLDGTISNMNKLESSLTSQSATLGIISKNIDTTTGEVREVTTTTGFTFNAEGSSIKDSEGYEIKQTPKGAYYKDGDKITGQYTKDGSKQKDLELFGTYSYGKENIDDTPMFIAQLYTDENGEECFGHFYNGGDY